MQYLIPVVLAVVVLWGVFKALQPRTVFVIKIAGNKVRIAKGKPPKRFLADCEELLASYAVEEAKITGVDRQGRVFLKFSRSIPQALRQKLRNVLSLSYK